MLGTDVSAGLAELDQILNEFLENQFNIPIELSFKKRIRHIKREKLNQKQELIKIVFELQVLQNKSYNYSKEDGEQMVDMIRTWVFLNEDLL